ncbi:MAG: hypothetical protein Unbinned2189contig1000_18 [Prokaryotic dsDNA virus sp.]|nr:MAG: hypothetical protein Unbinned2189contig1000_18 [Prokaryotic dsDNA virus sp.]|tara:strand:- start:252 stop:440 length:189 start_codon:yes stop_codon:yes gene_type:complete
MAEGIHFFRDGKPYKGEVHKMPGGAIHTGKTHNASSKQVYHAKDLSKGAKSKAMSIMKKMKG